MRRIDRMENERIRDTCSMRKGVNEVVSVNVRRWHERVRRMDENRLVKRI